MQLKISNMNKAVTLINTGEVNILKTPGLSEITFDAIIPQYMYPFAVYTNGFKEANYFLGEFEKLKIGMKPFQFKVVRILPSGELLFDTDMKVTLEEYTVVEDASNGLDLNVSFQLKQYRDYGTKQVIIKEEPNKTTFTATIEKQRPAPTPAKTYIVKTGDTLWGICKKIFGNGSKYIEIAKINGIKNPNLIYVGQVIKLG
jgi:LysM repeat protein